MRSASPSSRRISSVCWPSIGAGPPSGGPDATEVGGMAGLAQAAGHRVHGVLEEADRPGVRVGRELGR